MSKLSRLELTVDYPDGEELLRVELGDNGLAYQTYKRLIGMPPRIENMRIDPEWYQPPLLGMEKDVTYCRNMKEALAELARRKEAALIKYLGKRFRPDQDNPLEATVVLSDKEIEKYIEDHPGEVRAFAEEAFECIYDDFRETIKDIMKDAQYGWDVEGSNVSWRGDSGSTVCHDPDWVFEGLLSGYGDCTPTLIVEDCTDGKPVDEFKLIIRHHDCPVNGSEFVFKRRTEEKE